MVFYEARSVADGNMFNTLKIILKEQKKNHPEQKFSTLNRICYSGNTKMLGKKLLTMDPQFGSVFYLIKEA